MVATVAEVTVDLKTGQVRVTKFTTGQDCGLVVHQRNVVTAIEANLMQSMSRSTTRSLLFSFPEVMSALFLPCAVGSRAWPGPAGTIPATLPARRGRRRGSGR